MSKTPAIRLTYFDFHGGRGEPARLALAIAGIEFEDRRIKGTDWPALKSEMPFGSMPLLEVDGKSVTQSNGINRFVGKLAGLYPEDPWQAALCDEVMDALEDIGNKFSATFSMSEEDKKSTRETLAAGPLTKYLTRLNSMLAERGEYFADGRLTVADLKVMGWTGLIRSGNLDYIPKDLPDRVAPLLVQHLERVSAHPGVVAYYKRVKG